MGCSGCGGGSSWIYRYEWVTDSGQSMEFDTLDQARAQQAAAGDGVIRTIRLSQILSG